LGNFLLVASERGKQARGHQLYNTGLRQVQSLFRQKPNVEFSSVNSRAALFPTVAKPKSGYFYQDQNQCWVFSIGTWILSNSSNTILVDLLNRYHEIGFERLAGELEGFFVIVIGDETHNELVLITDLVGSCHAFLREFDGAIAISGSSLLLASLAPSSPDPIGIEQFLRNGIIYEDRTIYEGIRKLPPASVIRIADGRVRSVEKYWSAGQLRPCTLTAGDASERMWSAMSSAGKRIGKTFPNLVSDITGGYDSRLLLAGLLGCGLEPSTFVSGRPDSPDVVLGKQISAHFGLSNTHVDSTGSVDFKEVQSAFVLTDGEYNVVEYARILRSHCRLSSQFDISLNGSFGELARGYWWELLFPHVGAKRKLDAHRISRARFAPARPHFRLLRKELDFDLADFLARAIEQTNCGLEDAPNTLQLDHLYMMMRMQRWQGRIASSTNRLWPCLSLLGMRSILEPILEAKPSARERSYLVRFLLSRYMPELAKIPLEHGYPAEPLRITNVHRFIPVITYYAGKVGERLTRQLRRLPTTNSSNGIPNRLHLWQSAEVQQLMSQETPLMSVLDPSQLAQFLRLSQDFSFAFSPEWERLLSLQMAFQRAAEVSSSRP
jgi:hypothetical protein